MVDLHRIRISKDEPICRVCNEEEEIGYHVVFECAGLLGPINLLTGLPEWDLSYRHEIIHTIDQEDSSA